jgi:hypothetical protein
LRSPRLPARLLAQTHEEELAGAVVEATGLRLLAWIRVTVGQDSMWLATGRQAVFGLLEGAASVREAACLGLVGAPVGIAVGALTLRLPTRLQAVVNQDLDTRAILEAAGLRLRTGVWIADCSLSLRDAALVQAEMDREHEALPGVETAGLGLGARVRFADCLGSQGLAFMVEAKIDQQNLTGAIRKAAGARLFAGIWIADASFTLWTPLIGQANVDPQHLAGTVIEAAGLRFGLGTRVGDTVGFRSLRTATHPNALISSCKDAGPVLETAGFSDVGNGMERERCLVRLAKDLGYRDPIGKSEVGALEG